jgi:GNAT superfamily N-acetyltransferase
MTHRIQLAGTVQETERCFPVLRELRPTYDCERFVAQVQRQREQAGYALAFLEDGGEVRSVAGFRVGEMLAWHRAMYVDDLVTREIDRSKGYGEALFDWLVERARALVCDEFHLDSGVHRFGAHRFYLRKRMDITSHHFAMKLR